MAWLDQLQPASFRNVAFQVDTVDVQAGDNVVLREYPFQDLPTVFRMGEGAEEIRFSAYVIGDDYIEQRDRLKQVLTGDGVLVHPTAGALRVWVVGRYRISENPTAEGGMARFDLTFVRAEARRYPLGVTNTESSAIDAAAAAALAAQDAYGAGFDIASAPSWAADRALQRISDSLDAAWSEISRVTAGLADFSSELIGNYQTLRQDLNDLVRTPRSLASEVALLFVLPTDLSQAAAREFQAAYSSLFDMGLKVRNTDFETVYLPAPGEGLPMYGLGVADPLAESSPARVSLAALNAASDQLFETLATAAYVEVTAGYELEGYDQAMQIRQAVHDQCKRLLLNASENAAPASLPSSAWHEAVAGMLGAALADLQARSTSLVRLTTYTPEGWQPVWYVSYRLFGTADYADEILALNPHIDNPLLVPPGRPLRVRQH
jgi:prophage DNA circulation protein